MATLKRFSPFPAVCILTVCSIFLFLPLTSPCGVIIVNTNSDANFADDYISLREAILLSNSYASLGRSLTANEASQIIGGFGAGVADEIRFSNTYVITINDTLPRFLDANTVLNGYSAPLSAQNTTSGSSLVNGLNNTIRIRITGNGAVEDGLRIQANGCIVRGVSITNFPNAGIIWMSGGMKTSGKVEGCYLGITQAGAVSANGYGILIENNCSGIRIGGSSPEARNLLSGNSIAGVYVNGGDYCTISGNLIGTDASGQGDQGNGVAGILMEGNSVGDTIGGLRTNERNVLSGNDTHGIYIDSEGCDNTVIKNNFVGLARDGVSNLKNTTNGIRIEDGADNTLIGGDWDHNFVAYNNIGIYLNASTTTLTTISMNYIGFNINGGAAGNIGNGIHLDQAITATIGPKNRIGNNSESGITLIAGDASVIRGNYIGTDSSSVSPDFGNGLNGITVIGAAANNIIGGSQLSERNYIVFNANYGIEISEGSATNTVTNNYIGINANGIANAANGNAGIGILSGNVNTIGPSNVISGNHGCGILIYGPDTHGNFVKGNIIGLQANGTNILPNTEDGIRIENYLEPVNFDNIIGGDIPSDRNIISANRYNGVQLRGPFVVGNVVKGNFIGTTQNGNEARANDSCGIRIEHGAKENVIGSATVYGAGNVISGNTIDGITVHGAFDNEIYGNIIGLNPAGTISIQNQRYGIYNTQGSLRTKIGKNTTPSRNVVSGNHFDGILVDSNATARIHNNYIGTNPAGTSSISNGGSGIALFSGNNFVGSENPGYANVIAGNAGDGILIAGEGSNGNTILSNWIGQGATGNVIANGGDGVHLGDSVHNTVIGGVGMSRPNILRGNLGRGVYLNDGAGTGNLISGNSIYGNAELGIDLFDVGVNTNDNSDADTGPNRKINYPTFVYGNWDAGSKTLTCKVRHNATTANQRYPITVQLFTGGADGSGYGEGQTYLGQGLITAPNTTATIDIPSVASKPIMISAIAIDADNNTSEFSANYTVTVPVELAQFSAQVIDRSVQLRWMTVSEENNFGFAVERKSATASVLSLWNEVGFLHGAGSSKSAREYSFTDKNISDGVYLYRLKQIDLDGKIHYSREIEVRFRSPDRFVVSQNSPNPFSRESTTEIFIDVPGQHEQTLVRLSIFDSFGRRIFAQSYPIEKIGSHSIRLSGRDFIAGLYYYRIEYGSYAITRKMIVQE